MLEDEEVPTPLQAGGAHTVRTLPSGPAHAVRAPASGAPSRVRSAGRPADPRLHADEVMIASPPDASSARWHGATAPHASHAPHAASYFGSRHGSVGDPVAACNMAPVPARVAAAAYAASLPLPDAAMAGRIRSRAEAMRVRAAEQSAGAARTGARGATAASTTSGAPRSRRQRDFMSLMGSVFQHMSEEELAERLSHLYITRQHESLTDKLAGHDELLRAFRRGFIGPETITAFQAERRAAQSPSVRTLLSAMYARIDKRVRSLMLEEARRVLQQMHASQRAGAEGEGMSASGGAAGGAAPAAASAGASLPDSFLVDAEIFVQRLIDGNLVHDLPILNAAIQANTAVAAAVAPAATPAATPAAVRRSSAYEEAQAGAASARTLPEALVADPHAPVVMYSTAFSAQLAEPVTLNVRTSSTGRVTVEARCVWPSAWSRAVMHGFAQFYGLQLDVVRTGEVPVMRLRVPVERPTLADMAAAVVSAHPHALSSAVRSRLGAYIEASDSSMLAQTREAQFVRARRAYVSPSPHRTPSRSASAAATAARARSTPRTPSLTRPTAAVPSVVAASVPAVPDAAALATALAATTLSDEPTSLQNTAVMSMLGTPTRTASDSPAPALRASSRGASAPASAAAAVKVDEEAVSDGEAEVEHEDPSASFDVPTVSLFCLHARSIVPARTSVEPLHA